MTSPSPEERAKALVFSPVFDATQVIADIAAAIREAVEAERARCEAKVRAGLLFAKGEAERELNAGDGGNFQRWGFAASRLEIVLEDIRSRSEKP